jgi:hypothetical protein
VVKHICVTLYTELLSEWSPDTSAWTVGFLLGDLAQLVETERTLALVGIAHLCFLLSCIPHDTSSCDRHRHLAGISAMHNQTIWAYRARVRLYRGEGKGFQDAQRLALVGNV